MTKEIILPSNLKEIKNNAFYNCHSLEKINIPKNICDADEFIKMHRKRKDR